MYMYAYHLIICTVRFSTTSLMSARKCESLGYYILCTLDMGRIKHIGNWKAILGCTQYNTSTRYNSPLRHHTHAFLHFDTRQLRFERTPGLLIHHLQKLDKIRFDPEADNFFRGRTIPATINGEFPHLFAEAVPPDVGVIPGVNWLGFGRVVGNRHPWAQNYRQVSQNEFIASC